MGISHIVRLHELDVFGVWHSDEHILASNSKCLAQNPIDIGDMLEHLEYQHGVEGAVAERKRRIDIHDRQTLRFRLPQILEVDVTADTVQAVPHQNAAISPEAATQIKYGSSRMPVSKTHERPIVFAWPGRYSGLVKIVAGTNHVLVRVTTKTQELAADYANYADGRAAFFGRPGVPKDSAPIRVIRVIRG